VVLQYLDDGFYVFGVSTDGGPFRCRHNVTVAAATKVQLEGVVGLFVDENALIEIFEVFDASPAVICARLDHQRESEVLRECVTHVE
jgi:hypothetical protein